MDRSCSSVVWATRQPSWRSPILFVVGNTDVLEEDLVEMREPRHLPQRSDLYAGRLHVEQEPGDALVLRSLGVGPGEKEAPLRVVGPRRPHLLAVDDPLVAVGHSGGAQRRQVGSGSRFREQLAPDLLAGEQRWKEPASLFIRAVGDDGGAAERDADAEHGVGNHEGGALLAPDDLLHQRGTAAAVFGRPADSGPSVGGGFLLPLPARSRCRRPCRFRDPAPREPHVSCSPSAGLRVPRAIRGPRRGRRPRPACPRSPCERTLTHGWRGPRWRRRRHPGD